MEPRNASRPFVPAPANGNGRQSERRNPPQRENASSACSQCKLRKQKCRGGPPCDNCVKSGNTDCVIDETTDMRRKTCIKRKIDDLEQSQDLYANLFDTLQGNDDEKAAKLFRLIRNKVPLEDIRHQLDRGLDPIGPETSTSTSPGGLAEIQNMLAKPHDNNNDYSTTAPPQPHRRNMLDIRRLVDEPPFRVPASPWTVITKDDNLVSHLVSLWLTWSHPFWNSLDRKLFIRDMQAGKVECEFCSPFLVNSILAEACYYSDYQETFTVPGDLTSRGAHFYEEAKRLLDDEAGRISIPTLQGMVTLSVYTNLIGKDRLGIQYLTMASSAAEEYARSQLPSTREDKPLSDTERSISCALWGVFNATEMNGFAIMKFTNATAPKWPRPPTDHDEDDTWSLYPGPHHPVPAHTACVFNSYCELNCIHHEISRSLLSDGDRPKGAELESTVTKFHQRLQEWRDKIPSCINADNLSVPHILNLHMCYHTSLIQINFFLKNTTPETNEPETPAAAQAKQQCFTLAKETTSLIRLHRSKWGIERMSPTTIQWVSTSLFALIDGLDNTENRNAFIELCTVAHAFCRRWTLPKGILRMIQLTASQRGVALPGEVEALFMDFESQNWDRKDREKLSRSGYPNFAAIHKRDGDHEMDKFLEKWDTLHIDDSNN